MKHTYAQDTEDYGGDDDTDNISTTAAAMGVVEGVAATPAK